MGQDVVCQQCGKRLAIEDFTMGAAQTIGNRAYCTPCMPASEVKTILSPTPAPAPAPPPPPARDALPIVIGAAAVAVLAVLAAVVVFRPVKPAAPSPTPPAAAASAGGTASPAPAPLPKDAAARRARIESDLRALKIRVDVPAKVEKLGAAIGILRDARKAHDDPEWIKPIDDRLIDLQQTADTLYAQLLDQAVEFRKRGVLAEVDKIIQRVAQWEMPVHAVSLERALAAIRIAEPVPAHGLRLIPAFAEAGRIHRRHGLPSEKGVEGVQYGGGRTVGFEGDLFRVPSDGDIQVTFVTDVAQTIQIRLMVLGEHGRTVSYEFTIRQPAAGKAVQVKAPFGLFRGGGAGSLPAGSIVKQLHVQGQDAKVAFRVTELTVAKRRD